MQKMQKPIPKTKEQNSGHQKVDFKIKIPHLAMTDFIGFLHNKANITKI